MKAAAIACGALLTVGLVLVPSAARAQNYRSIPIGGRTATMGGAGIAAGNDSAMPYLNPAGLAGLPGDVFAVSASVYGLRKLSIDRLLVPNGYPADLGRVADDQRTFSSSSSFELPAAVMYVKGISGEGTDFRSILAGSLVIPSHTDREFISSVNARFPSTNTLFSMSLASIDRARDMYVGGTWAGAYKDRLRIGASLFMLYTTGLRSTKIDSSFLLANGSLPGRGAQAFVEQLEGYGVAVMAGAQLRVVGNLWVGITLGAPTFALGGKGTSSLSVNDVNVDVNAGSSTLTSIESTYEYDVKVKRPMRVGLGVAWDDREAFSFAVDGTLFLAQPEAERLDGVETTTRIQTREAARSFKTAYVRQRDHRMVVDVSAGAELRMNKFFSVRAGVMTAHSARPPVDANYVTSFRGTLREDLYGGTLGLGITVGSFDSTIGFAYQYSRGKFPAADVSQPGGPIVAVDAIGHTLMMVLSGAVTVAEAKATIEKNAPTPAKVFLP